MTTVMLHDGAAAPRLERPQPAVKVVRGGDYGLNRARRFARMVARVLALAIVLGLVISVLYSHAKLTELSGEINEVNTQLAAARSEDYKNYCTTIGPHRDNMEVSIAGISARSFGSQGQQRSCALALKLAQCRVMEETLGEAPIILLDDVLSELDKTRREYFLHGKHPGQVFITCCDRNAARTLGDGAAFRMKEGQLYLPGERAKKRKEP